MKYKAKDVVLCVNGVECSSTTVLIKPAPIVVIDGVFNIEIMQDFALETDDYNCYQVIGSEPKIQIFIPK